jgi:hypothetical protein
MSVLHPRHNDARQAGAAPLWIPWKATHVPAPHAFGVWLGEEARKRVEPHWIEALNRARHHAVAV